LPGLKPVLKSLSVPRLEIADPLAAVTVFLVVRKALEIVASETRALTAMVESSARAAQGNLARAPEGLPLGLDAPGTAHSLPKVTVATKDPTASGEILHVHRMASLSA
jgi:hypothetical protein